jgi:aldehyde dehydrogenase family protein
VNNIAGRNRQLSELVHAMLVQALAGNAVIAEIPDDGGAAAFVSLACALSVREGLPFTLLGGRGRGIREGEAAGLVEQHIPEQEGLDHWGIWDYSDWKALTPLIRGTYGLARRRSTAGSRYVVRRSLLDDFLEAYLPAVRSVRYGHPLAVASPEDALPDLDFGPLTDAARAEELYGLVRDAVERGAVPVHQGSLEEGRFLPGQDTSAYLAPTALLVPSPFSSLSSSPSPSPVSPLRRAQPFGPVETIVPVDTEEELLAAMNDGDGAGTAIAGTASLSTDDRDVFARLAPRIRAVNAGHDRPRSRGDRDGHSHGEALVRAVTDGPSCGSRPGGSGDRRPRGPRTEADPNTWRPDRPPERAARRKPRRAARSPGITEVKTAAGAWYGCPRRHGRAGRRPLSGWRNGRRASLRC